MAPSKWPERHFDTQQFFSHTVGGSIVSYYCKCTRRNACVHTHPQDILASQANLSLGCPHEQYNRQHLRFVLWHLWWMWRFCPFVVHWGATTLWSVLQPIDLIHQTSKLVSSCHTICFSIPIASVNSSRKSQRFFLCFIFWWIHCGQSFLVM